MTSPAPTQAEKTAADHAQTFLDWTKVNSSLLTIGGAVVVVAAAAFWFYSRSQAIKSANAETALGNAKQSLVSGNQALAKSDLESVLSKYGGTGAGVEAAMLLATMDYDAGKPQDGINRLEQVAGKGAAASSLAAIRALEGDGYSQLGKLPDAAKQYEAAAGATTFPLEKEMYESKAARIYQATGDTAKARALWTTLGADPSGSMAAEAKVRLGELEARPVR